MAINARHRDKGGERLLCRYSRPSHSVACPKRIKAAANYSLPRERTIAAAPAIQAIRIPSAM